MKIVQKMWYYDSTEGGGNDFHSPIRCSVCDHHLRKWYVNIIKSLEKFLPENFEPLCCACAVLKALAKRGLIPSNRCCSVCGHKIVFANVFKGWEFKCGGCGVLYCNLTDEETFKLTQEYFKSL